MWGVLAAIALIPSPPVLVPQLARAAAGEVAGFRDAALTAAAGLPDRWVVIGAGARGDVIGPHSRGTFAGYGVDVPVTLSPQAPDTVSALPLCALIAGWLRGQASPAASAEVRVYATDLDAAAAMAAGRALRAEIDGTDAPIGVLVVADGANTITPPAPLPGLTLLLIPLAGQTITGAQVDGEVAPLQTLAGHAAVVLPPKGGRVVPTTRP